MPNVRCKSCGLLVQVPAGGRRLCGCGAWLSGDDGPTSAPRRDEPIPAMPIMTALSGNEMFCLNLKGYSPGELVIDLVDGGLSTDPNDLAERAQTGGADFIALSSYNGVALQFVTELVKEIKGRDLDIPIFIGGKLNRIPDGSNTSLPVDVTPEIAATGAVVCTSVEAMLEKLTAIAAERLPNSRGVTE